MTSLVATVDTRSPEVRLFGRVETPNTARLTALITAPVESLRVREGDRAARGDVLVQLDGTDTALLVRRRESDLVDARASLDALKLAGADDREVLTHQEELHRLATEKVARYRRLREQRTIAEETLKAVLEEHHAQAIALSRQRRLVADFEHRLASATAHVERALASLEEARVAHERTRIRAPFPGRVTRIPVAPGELVAPGTTVAEIYDDGALEIRVQIPNVHLPAVQSALAAGDRLPVVADLGDRQARGELERLVGAVGSGQSGVDGLVRLAAGAAPPDLGRAVSLTVTFAARGGGRCAAGAGRLRRRAGVPDRRRSPLGHRGGTRRRRDRRGRGATPARPFRRIAPRRAGTHVAVVERGDGVCGCGRRTRESVPSVGETTGRYRRLAESPGHAAPRPSTRCRQRESATRRTNASSAVTSDVSSRSASAR